MKKICMALVISILIITCMNGITANAIGVSSKNQAQIAAESWFIKNYSDYYDIRNMSNTLIKTINLEYSTRYTISISCETKLKINDVEDLPFVKGMRAEKATATKESAAANKIIEQYVDEINGYIGNYYPLALDVVVEINNSVKNGEITLYYQDAQTTVLLPISDLIIDESEMTTSGANTYNQILLSANGVSARGYDAYNRLDARDYALDYSSNPTDCYDCGTTCGMQQDRTKWNNDDYPYITNLKHGDCADFVSQAMHAGGIPIETGVWDRFNDGANGWSWTSGIGLKNYMVDKGYWDTTTFALCNAGNIIRWISTSASANHVGMVTMNDTVTHRYSAHTNDCCNFIFTNSTYYQNNCEYFMIKFN